MLKSGDPSGSDWQQINRHGAQGTFHKGEIISTRDAVENRRARMILGGAGAMQLSQPAMEYDMTQSYPGQTWVHVGSANIAATTGTTDPVSGLAVKSAPGWYCSCPGGVPIAAGPAYHIPQAALPNPDNIDDPNNFWVIFIADSQCY